MAQKLEVGGLTLNGFAQGGVRTAYYVPEYRFQLDSGSFIPKSADRIFQTHGHPDHIGCLPGIAARRQIREDPSPLEIYAPQDLTYPIDIMLRGLDACFSCGNKNPRPQLNYELKGLEVGDEVSLTRDATMIAVQNYHGVPGLGYAVRRTTKKLRAEFMGRPGPELGQLKRDGVQITDDVDSIALCISGDTRIEFLVKEPLAQQAKVLVHEVTFWDNDQSDVRKTRRHGHTHVDEMIEHCEMFEGDYLVLCHRSMRYSRAEIEGIIKARFPSSMLSKIVTFDGGDIGNPDGKR